MIWGVQGDAPTPSRCTQQAVVLVGDAMMTDLHAIDSHSLQQLAEDARVALDCRPVVAHFANAIWKIAKAAAAAACEVGPHGGGWGGAGRSSFNRLHVPPLRSQVLVSRV